MNSKKTTVSLCMIAYNEETVINGILRDFSTQDYPLELIEVILVDGESTDKTKKIMREFRDTDYGFKDVKILKCDKHRQAASWNVALLNSSCDVIIRIDAHAKIPRNYVSRCVSNLQSEENVVGGGRPNVTEDKSSWKLTLLAAEDSLFGSSVATYRRPPNQKEYLNSLFHAAYKKEVFEKVGGFNEDLGRTEDNEMHYRIRKAGFKLCSCPDILSYQLTRNSLQNMIRQKYSNGFWIGLTLGTCPGCLSYYHLVPLLFVLAILGSALFALFGNFVPLIILGSLYGMFDFVNTIGCFTNQRVKPHFVLLPFIFPLLHVTYGVGTLVGIIYMPFWRMKLVGSDAKKTIEKVKRKFIKNK